MILQENGELRLVRNVSRSWGRTRLIIFTRYVGENFGEKFVWTLKIYFWQKGMKTVNNKIRAKRILYRVSLLLLPVFANLIMTATKKNS